MSLIDISEVSKLHHIFVISESIENFHRHCIRRGYSIRNTITNNNNAKLLEIREEFRKLGGGSIDFNPIFSPGIGLITLNNLKKHNSLSGKMMAELADLVDRLEKNLVGLILTGSENTFCSDLSVAKDHIITPENGKKMSLLMQDTLFRFNNLPLISIAAIEGYALGGGAELATACDHRCVSEKSKIRFVQVKMAATSGWGGGNRLINIVGRNNALKLLGKSEFLSYNNSHQQDQQDIIDIGFVDVVSKEGGTIKKSIEFLDSYIYFHSKKQQIEEKNRDEEHHPRKRNSVNAVTNHNSTETQKKLLDYEHEIFCKLWGEKENIQAILKSKN
ncbi:5644_t:CDS:2 [Entrophospora sp. SA101]|nr:5644_t:CDS:2 [Entrophospora sp. SA101]CAJ0830482.1 2586_t:CDS:2 [Entrophospora sp. SA101]